MSGIKPNTTALLLLSISFLGFLGGDHHFVVVNVDVDGFARYDAARDDPIADRSLEVADQGSLQWTCSEVGIEAGLGECADCFGSDLETDVLLFEPEPKLPDHELHDLVDRGTRERLEQDDVINPVQELWLEGAVQVVHDSCFCRLHDLAVHNAIQQVLRADVAGEDDHGILEVDLSTLRICHVTVVEDLQQHVEHVGVRLLDLVEEHHTVRLAAHCLGELAALVIADVAGGRPGEPADGVLLHVLGHVDAHHCILAVEQHVGERLRELGLADASGPEEHEGADRPLRILDPGASA